ncbi:response regulator [Rheinheimera sp. WS51]|uniref:CHASE domain-containing hybrid sensor histidine kinase/response regulator n=1 Tax=Rheinheimera sp. WS51 TaxID=3425886 RepID=UPI003D910E6C
MSVSNLNNAKATEVPEEKKISNKGKVTHLGKLFLLPLLVMTLCIFISLHFIKLATDENNEHIKKEMQQRLQEVSTAISEKMSLYQYGLSGLRSAILTNGHDNLSHETIINYSASRDSKAEFPGARGFGLIRNIRPSELPDFMVKAGTERDREFTLQTLDNPNDSYFVIQYIEPEIHNYNAVGLNIGSEAMRRNAALNAAKKNQTQLTAPITLVQAEQKSQQGFLLLMPIYTTLTTPSSELKRLEQLFGWSYAPILIDEILATVSDVKPDITLAISDVTDDDELNFYNYGNNKTAASVPAITNSLDLFGRTWQLTMAVQPSFIDVLQLTDTKKLLRQYIVISSLIVLLIFFIQILFIRRRQLAEKQAQLIAIKAETLQAANAKLEQQVIQRTAEIAQVSNLQRSIVNGTNYAVIATDIDGIITLFNPAAEKMLGYSSKEVVNKQSPSLFHLKDEVEQYAKTLSAKLQTTIAADFSVFVALAKLGEQNEAKWTYVRKDGSHCPVKLRITALMSDDNRLIGFLGIAEDLTEQQQLEFELELTRVSVEKAADPMFWLNSSGDILKANPAALRIFGAENLLERTILSVEQGSSEQQWSQIVDLLHKQSEVRFNRHYQTHSGTIIPVSITATLFEFAKTEYIYLVARDISAQQQREQELATARDNANKANEAKSAFLANMSHEIRTPMNAILGLLQLIQQTDLTNQQRNYIKKTQVASQSLLTILNDILDFSKVESGKLELELHSFSLTELLHELAVILTASAADKHLEILYDLATDIPDLLIGDALRIKQILINLAGNAIKFTAQGEVIISVKASNTSGNNILLEIAIKDTGIGMTKEQINHIFSGFQQAESSISRRFGGTGLGLAISKRLAELMQGSISVTSTPNVGSEFTVTLALQVADEQVQPKTLSLPKQLKVLIVDDNHQARLIMSDIVQSFNWTSNAVEDGKSALKAIKEAISQQHKYDLILLDWHMPEQNGLEVAKTIQTTIDKNQKPRIIMVSAYSKDIFSYRANTDKELIDGFIMKPMTHTLLAQELQEVFHGPALSEQLIQHQPEQQNNPLQNLTLLLVEDNLTNQLVASELLSQLGAKVDIASSGKEALAKLTNKPEQFAVVLMDIQMPEMDGYQTTYHIRNTLKLTQLPIIAMTANAMASDIKACLEAGMQDHVAKPFNLTELSNKILLHTKNSAVIDQEPAELTNEAVPTALIQYTTEQEIDFNSALQRLGNSVEFYSKVLQQFKVDIEQYQSQLINQQQSVNDQLLIFHSLKSTAAMLGFNQLSKSASELEQQLDQTNTVINQTQQVELMVQLSLAQEQSVTILQLLLSDVAEESLDFNLEQLADNINLLQSQLNSANMAALGLFEQLESSLLQLAPEITAQLDQALTTLDFASAEQLVVKLKQIIDRRMNEQ